jgi:ATP-binding cassette subfamily B protein
MPGIGAVVRRFWPWIREERPLIAGSMGALAAGVLMRLAEPWPLKFVLDRVIPTDRPAGMNSVPRLDGLDPVMLLALCAVATLAVTAVRATCDYYQRIGFAKIGNRVLRRVREHVYLHLQGLSLGFHTRSRSGDLIVRVTRDVGLLRDVMSTALLPLVGSVLILAGMAAVMLMLQWKLALLAMTTLPIYWLVTTRLSRGIHQAARKQRRREGALATTAAESITAIRDVQALSLQETFAGTFSTSNRLSQKEELQAARLSAQLGRTVDVLLAVSTALVMGYGGMLILGGALTPGDLLVFLTYLKRAFRPAKDFAKHTGRLAKAAAAGERVIAILDETPEVQDLPGARPAPALRGAIRLRDVDFSFGDAPVLKGVDLTIDPGQSVVLTGPSGGGKSTLISLLLRLYDPASGAVEFDGSDVRDFEIGSVRPQIGVVLQDTLLFAGTIGENIALGVPGATTDEISGAARLAGAHDFVVELPDGYDTVVGERGVTLSHGQRQRIAIARAALRDTSVLVLDEPTTGLDDASERKVVEALRKLTRGRTTVLVTHDMKLATRADLVLYLEGGRIVESGSPAELTARGGRFADLCRRQGEWARAQGGTR